MTMIGALGCEGRGATRRVAGGTDGEVFRSYVEQVLAPQLRPGHMVVMGGLRAHKVAGIRGAIEARGGRLQYLPPYSPEFSPMELARSKLKAGLRARAARTRAALEPAWAGILPSVTTRDARRWFARCGYCTTLN